MRSEFSIGDRREKRFRSFLITPCRWTASRRIALGTELRVPSYLPGMGRIAHFVGGCQFGDLSRIADYSDRLKMEETRSFQTCHHERPSFVHEESAFRRKGRKADPSLRS